MCLSEIELLQRVDRWDADDWHGFTVPFITPADLFQTMLERGYFARHENLGFYLTKKGRTELDRWFESRRRYWS